MPEIKFLGNEKKQPVNQNLGLTGCFFLLRPTIHAQVQSNLNITGKLM